jgi:surface protein
MSYVPELVGLYEIRPFIIWPLEDGTFIKAVFDYLAGGEKKDAVIMRYGHINDWDLSNVDDGKIPNKWLGKIPLEDDTIHAAVNDYLEGDELIKKAVIIKYGKIEYWNVSKVTDMSHLFQNKTEFNESIGASGRRKGWNVSNVTKMSHMFDGATSFNQPIGSWDVSNVTDMSYMFKDAWNFNQFRGSPRWYTGPNSSMLAM